MSHWLERVHHQRNQNHVSQRQRQILKLQFAQSKLGTESHFHSWSISVHYQGLTTIWVTQWELNCGKLSPVKTQSKHLAPNTSSKKVSMLLGQGLDGISTGQVTFTPATENFSFHRPKQQKESRE